LWNTKDRKSSAKNKIFHTQDLCLRINLGWIEKWEGMEINMLREWEKKEKPEDEELAWRLKAERERVRR